MTMDKVFLVFYVADPGFMDDTFDGGFLKDLLKAFWTKGEAEAFILAHKKETWEEMFSAPYQEGADDETGPPKYFINIVSIEN